MLTQRQIRHLVLAVELAERPPRLLRRYVGKGRPLGVIAQLAFLEGVSLEAMAALDKRKLRGIGCIMDPSHGLACLRPWEVADGPAPEAEKLSGYPVQLLLTLQRLWDYARPPSGCSRRESLRRAVDQEIAASSPQEFLRVA